ncbi:hypothetical protein [Streptomyces sp. NPDC091215]|uniref:hypothetical protein n=1 Tax=Streptomyces sp. NPDC091215 TaxID=3155192 RepID=UPI00343E97F2
MPLLDGQVQLGGQATARASEAMADRLGADAAGRLLLQIPLMGSDAGHRQAHPGPQKP